MSYPQDFEPTPPPIQVPRPAVPPPPPPVVRRDPPAPQTLDLSATDPRTVTAFALAALGGVSLLVCILFGPFFPAAGLVFAVFSKPSTARNWAVIVNVAILAFSLVWILWAFFDFALDPAVRRALR